MAKFVVRLLGLLVLLAIKALEIVAKTVAVAVAGLPVGAVVAAAFALLLAPLARYASRKVAAKAEEQPDPAP